MCGATYSQGGGPSSDARRSPYSDLPERNPPVTNVNMQPGYRIRRESAGCRAGRRVTLEPHPRRRQTRLNARTDSGQLTGRSPASPQAARRPGSAISSASCPRSARKRLRGDQVPR